MSAELSRWIGLGIKDEQGCVRARPRPPSPAHFWALALAGFVGAGLALAGIAVPVDALRPLALVSAIVSLAGIGLFLGTWPAFSTLAAIAVNVAVLVALLR